MGDPEPGSLLLQLSCPKCGAPLLLKDDTRSLVCGHCGSLLAVGAPERDEAWVAFSQIADAADLQALVLEYRVQSYRAQLVGSMRDREGNAPAELLVEPLVQQFEGRLRARLQVGDARRFHAPYWHLGGWVVQAVLGRHADGPKRMRIRAYFAEDTVPAYDAAHVNLRDRGLRTGRARVRPLVAGELEAARPYLPWRPATTGTYREVERALREPLEPGFDATARHGMHVHGQRMLLYRPYWVARVGDGERDEWLLADGQFRTIAGYPEGQEVERWTRALTDDPFRAQRPAWRRLVVTASRCPDCGHELVPASADRVVLCGNCHRGVQPGPEGMRLVPVSHARAGQVDLDATWVPFWRFPFPSPERGLDALWRSLFGDSVPRGRKPAGAAVWVPAVRLLGTPAGDEVFQQLVAWVHATPLDVTDAKAPIGGHARFVSATLDAGECGELVRTALFGLLDGAAAARLSGRGFQRVLQTWDAPTAGGRLVLVPFTRVGDALAVPGGTLTVPERLLLGGPDVEARRVTVHAARRAAQPVEAPSAAEKVRTSRSRL